MIKDTAPNAYLLKVAKWFQFNPTVNVDRLRQYVVRAGAQVPQGPLPGAAHDVYEVEASVARGSSRDFSRREGSRGNGYSDGLQRLDI